jgi:hypothetical protein
VHLRNGEVEGVGSLEPEACSSQIFVGLQEEDFGPKSSRTVVVHEVKRAVGSPMLEQQDGDQRLPLRSRIRSRIRSMIETQPRERPCERLDLGWATHYELLLWLDAWPLPCERAVP